MIIDNKYLLGQVGWIPEYHSYGVYLCVLPQCERERAQYSLVISHSFLKIVWAGWTRWPLVRYWKDERYAEATHEQTT